jgi:hypothetical protein
MTEFRNIDVVEISQWIPVISTVSSQAPFNLFFLKLVVGWMDPTADYLLP